MKVKLLLEKWISESISVLQGMKMNKYTFISKTKKKKKIQWGAHTKGIKEAKYIWDKIEVLLSGRIMSVTQLERVNGRFPESKGDHQWNLIGICVVTYSVQYTLKYIILKRVSSKVKSLLTV